jgi:tetratricopeptide (TPR) repeat protein
MKALHIALWLGLLIGLWSELLGLPTRAQTTSPKEAQPAAPGLQKLTGDDAKRAEELGKSIGAALNADRWDEAIERAQELLALRRRVQGPNHHETVDAEWDLQALRRVAPMARQDRAAYRSVKTMGVQAEALSGQGKYSEAQPLYEQALEISRRLLTDNHPHTATSYENLASNLVGQGKYVQAQPLIEKALKIRRGLLSDDHPDTALSYSWLATNLNEQAKYAEAQPLFEKALEIARRLLSDEHPNTASAYNNLAMNLNAQAKYAAAQPLLEKALEIDRRLLTDNHPNTAGGYNNLAINLDAQAKYAMAQPLHEKALEIIRGLFTDNHPLTAICYDSVATNLRDQGKYSEAQPLFEKALEIRRLLSDDHPQTANSYNNLASNLNAQGKYALAQPLYEKALEMSRRLLTDDHPDTAKAYNLNAQGKHLEATDEWLRAVKSLDAVRLRVAFGGLERTVSMQPVRPALAVALARLGRPAEASQRLEEDLGRGLLDELAAREDQRLTAAEQARLRELTSALERLDRLVEATPQGLDKAERAKRFAELGRQRELASIALGEFQTKLVQHHGAQAGQVAGLDKIQAALPADVAMIAWVDLSPRGPNAADPDREHWGVVVRSRGTPAWVPIAGTGKDGLWTKDDTGLADRVRTELRRRPGVGAAELQPLLERLRTQRLAPLATALGASADGQPPARRLIVLPSRAIAGIPVEAMLAPGDARTVSYAPSASVFKLLRERPRPGPHAGLLALGDPIYEPPEKSSEPQPLPDHGLLITVVAPGSNAATHGVKRGDVLLDYAGTTLRKSEDLKTVARPGPPVAVGVWRDGRLTRHELEPGALGVVFDPQPVPAAIAEQRQLQQMLVAARSGGDDFARLPGTRYEVESLARLFKSDDRPTKTLLSAEASEPELDRLAGSGELGRYGFIHLATHGVIDEGIPSRSAVILTQIGLPDPLEQVLAHRPIYDGRLLVREIQRTWELKAELVTLSGCETALGPNAGGEGFVGFTQALLMSGARSVCLSLWKVDDTATALLMQRFYADLLGARAGLSQPLPKTAALAEAKAWLRGLHRDEVTVLAAQLSGGESRAAGAKARKPASQALSAPAGAADDRPYAHPYYWAAFVLVGDPD